MNKKETLSKNINTPESTNAQQNLENEHLNKLFLLELSNYEKGDVESSCLIYKRNTKNSTISSNEIKQQIFLSHFYEENPKDINIFFFTKQMECYRSNQVSSLAKFHGFGIIKQNDYFLPIAFTERPVNGPLPTKLKICTKEQKFLIIAGTIQGLAFIHNQDFIHSNLNPTTVYLNENYQPVICDYIFVPQFKVEPSTPTENFQFKYSIENKDIQKVFKNIQYVAPEIWKDGQLSWQSDIFSLGLLIFYVLTEKVATFSENEIEYPHSFPEEWKTIINKCVSVDPTKRPPAKEILKEILNEDSKDKLISSITISSNTTENSEKTKMLLKIIKLDFENEINEKSSELNIFHVMLPSINDIDDETSLIVSAAEKGDIQCIEKVGYYFHTGEKKFIQDDEYAYMCYKYAAEEGSLHSILQVAQFNEEGIGTEINLDKSIKFYQSALEKMEENDPKRPEIQSKIDKLTFESYRIILTRIPLNKTKDDIVELFKNIQIKIINVETSNIFQEMTIQFFNSKDLNTARRKIRRIKYRIGKYPKNTKNFLFDSIEKFLPRFDFNDFYPGKGNDEYQIIGNGRYYDIYLIYKKNTEEPFAVKVFTDFEDNKIKREIINTCKLDHPTFLKYVGFSEFILNKKRLAVLLDFVPIGNLDDLIPKLDNTKKLKIIIGIANALLEMYSKNIIHRNLDTGIILLNEKYEPVIGDLLFSNQKENLTTNAKNSIFTAPELYNYDINLFYSYSANSYSFGIILYQILTSVKKN